MPKRIQLRRTKGWRKPPNTVVVSRPSKWGNPFRIEPHSISGRERAFAEFRDALLYGRLSFTTDDVRRELRGKNLACWCPVGSRCHADVLLGVANA